MVHAIAYYFALVPVKFQSSKQRSGCQVCFEFESHPLLYCALYRFALLANFIDVISIPSSALLVKTLNKLG